MTSMALVGAQYGSEGKGVIAAGLAPLFKAAVRTGGPNAGHSFYHHGELYKMRQVPCAWVSPTTRLFLGAGAVLDPELLEAEAERVQRIVVVDPQAVIITHDLHQQEVTESLREKIGSTTEGVGAARIAKIWRNGGVVLAKDYDWKSDYITIDDVAAHLRDAGSVFLEGTQGSGLSLHHGHYPFVTSNDTNAAQLAADAGLPPTAVEHTHLVVRTHPIRVAGNSGPTGGLELSWDSLVEAGVVDKPERTTVTNNIRRIFTFDRGDLDRAIMLNDPCGVWVTFGDYIDPKATNAPHIDAVMDGPLGDWLRENIFPTGLRLMGVGVGGPGFRVLETGDACNRLTAGHHPMVWPLTQEAEDLVRG